LVEVDCGRGRLAYGPVSPADVAGLFEAGFPEGGAHPLALGPTGDIPYLKNQERLTFARVGLTDPVSSTIIWPRRLPGLRRALDLAPRPSSTPSRSPVCGAGAARRFPPASSGGPY